MLNGTQFSVPELKPSEFANVRELVYREFGLDLREGKQGLVSARLGKYIRSGGFRSFSEYLSHVKADHSGESLISLIDALTTNHTGFLREADHFRFLTELIDTGRMPRERLRIWCAAASTGEEPYSIVFTVLDALAQIPLDFRLLATDISTRALASAERAIYPCDRVGPVPPDWLRRYFLRGQGKAAGFYKVKPEVRGHVIFRRHNLMHPLPAAERFSLIFCRNVMIYFDPQTKADLVKRLTGCLETGGYLIVGHAESLTGVAHGLTYVQPAIYRRPA